MSYATDGYVTDLPYLSHAYPSHAPISLAFAATLSGVAPPALDDGAVIWELGCGHANGLLSAAAAQPGCHFVGVDFNPAHIAAARRRAARLGLANVTLLEADFTDLAADPAALPDCDLVILHGVYAWVGAATKAALRTLLRRHVRAGGLVYVSYNSLPGSGGMSVLQRALSEAARLSVGRSDQRLSAAAARVRAMREAGAVHLTEGPLLDSLFEALEQADPAYLAHEYMNGAWAALYHSDVAADMAEAKLDFIGSAAPHETFPALMLTAEQQAALHEVPPGTVRETLRDFFIPRILRKDLFVRGPQRLTEGQRDRALDDMLFCAASNPDEAARRVTVPAGQIDLAPAYHEAGRRLWTDGPLPLSALVAGPFAASDQTRPEAAALLVSGALAWPCLGPPGDGARSACRRSIAAAAETVREQGLQAQPSILSPRVGSEFPLAGLEVLVLDRLADGMPAEPTALVDAAWSPMEAAGETLIHEGRPLDDPARCRALLEDMVRDMLPERLPLWRALGMLPQPEAPPHVP